MMMAREAELKKQLAKATAVMNWCLKSEAAPRIHAMLDMAKSEPGIAVLPEQFDRDPWLFNCPNGTVEMKTAKLREHRRGDYITKLCPVSFDTDAACPAWMRFLHQVFAGNDAIVRYLQRVFGMCLTGDTSEQAIWIFWGTGSNGKSVLVNTILEILGEDYAVKAARDLFLAHKSDNHPTQLARLFGRRLVICAESGMGSRLDEVLVKELTGGDPIQCRRMREDPWQFVPVFKPILVTNHKPQIRGTDVGIWRRCRLVPFTVRFWDGERGESGPPELEADKTLPLKLQREFPGILAWMVQGCLDWQAEGLQTPPEVLEATKEYRDGEDVVAQFLAERCFTGPDYRGRASELYSAYRSWCEHTGEEPFKQKSFGQTMTDRGFKRETSNGTWYVGVALRDAFEE
jgi:putative DNA primase/helicase